MNKKITFGYDIGITSCGWAVMDNETNELIEQGVSSFPEAQAASSARLNRSARRTLRRKKWRLKQLKRAFVDFELLGKNFFDEDGNFDTTLNHKKDDSIYHLRKRALSEQVSVREIFLCVYNIAKTRGHFLLETIDFTKDGSLTPDIFYQKFYDLAEKYVVFIDKENFENLVLQKIYNVHVKEKDIKAIFKTHNFVDKEDDEFAQDRLYLILKLFLGYKVNLEKIDEEVALESSGTKNIIDLKKNMDILNDFLLEVVDIYDMLETARILSEYDYLCEKHVVAIDQVAKIQRLSKNDPDEYKIEKNEIQKYMTVKKKKIGNKLKVVKNIQNVYPNGLYVKEVIAVLKNQQQYYEKITDEFIDVCCMIVKARIPYYVGPLSNKAKNNWVSKKDGKFKYSYEYCAKQLIDEHETIKKWKEAMTSRCTYLPEELAMAKGSFAAELFVILNELNVLYAEDHNEQRYYLNKDDKYRVLNELFLKKTTVAFQDVKNLLNLNYFGIAKDSTSVRKKFNKNFSVYHQVTNVLEDLKIVDINTFFSNTKSIEQLEKIIEVLCLFDEELGKADYFENTLGYSKEFAKKLSRINTKDYMRLSKKFVMQSQMDSDGHSLLEKLMEDNTCEYTNEQMTIIKKAHDGNGEMLDYSGSKYEAILKKNPELGMHLLMDDNKPFIPIARPVIRGLNECFKVHSELIKVYGVPERVVLETAKDMKDMDLQGKEKARHFDEMKKLHEYLLAQLKEKKMKRTIIGFDDLHDYLIENKKKIELYIRQNGKCLITGDTIHLSDLSAYDIDHILPRGFGDNSMDNSLLMHRELNKRKGDRTPIEFMQAANGEYSEKAYKKRVYDLFEMGMISEEKKYRLLLRNQEDALGFVQRNLVDTRYIVKEFTSILKAYSNVHQQDTKYISLKAGFTGMYRGIFNLRKSRDHGLQHHAHDAAIIMIVDKVLSTLFPNYESHGNQKRYTAFLKEVSDKGGNSQNKNKSFIKYGYKKAFGHDYRDDTSFIKQVRRNVPLVAYKVDKKYTGEFFNATIYGKEKTNLQAPLNLLKVNNDKRNFSSVNCAAVDFYKITTAKGEKKHFAVHIPKVIVKANGTIDEEKYKILVKEHYKYTDLLDTNGELIRGAFRLRMRRGDVFYDTHFKQPMYFNIGSIAERKLEKKVINMFSYDNVTNLMSEVIDKFKYDIRNKDISDSDVKKGIEIYLYEKFIEGKEQYNKFFAAIKKALHAKDKNIYECIKDTCYLIYLLNEICLDDLPPTIIEQNSPVINRTGLMEDAQYVKVVYSPLGIRYARKNVEYTLGNDEVKRVIALNISGPKDAKNHFKLIKKETFTWQL
ncbi:MAG: type II CRISPR RNA-guided endonuclease Cas9 [Breznakia sp.]